MLPWHNLEDKKGTHRFGYTNNLALNESNADIRVNMLHYEWTTPQGEVKIFTWITGIKLTKSNFYKIMRMGRSRWKIENETFNKYSDKNKLTTYV